MQLYEEHLQYLAQLTSEAGIEPSPEKLNRIQGMPFPGKTQVDTGRSCLSQIFGSIKICPA